MGNLATSATRPPAPAVIAILSRFDRSQLEGFIEIAIELTETLDGDPDIELNGDEADGSLSEDDFNGHNCPMHLQGPGCPISDPAEEDDHCGQSTEDELSSGCVGMHHGPGCRISDEGIADSGGIWF